MSERTRATNRNPSAECSRTLGWSIAARKRTSLTLYGKLLNLFFDSSWRSKSINHRLMAIEQITASLGNGETKVFETFHELRLWIEQEKQFWAAIKRDVQWPMVGPAPWTRFDEFFTGINARFQEADRVSKEAEQKKIEPDYAVVRTRIENTFAAAFENGLVVSSSSPIAKFIADVSTKQGSNVGWLTFFFLTGVEGLVQLFGSRIDIASITRAGAVAVLFQHGLAERAKAEAAALTQMRVEWSEKFQQFADTIKQDAARYAQFNVDAAESLTSQRQSLTTLLADQQDQVKGALHKTSEAVGEIERELRKQVADLKAFMTEEIALQTPVRYWTDKANGHRWVAWIFGVLSAAAAAGLAVGLGFEVRNLLTVPQGVSPATWHPEYWRLGIVTVSGLFGIWFVRILVRLFLSNVHLLTDSRERVTMVKTYLALLRRDKALGNEDRQLILQAMFRPSAAGGVKDDAVPISVVEALAKLRQ